MNSDQLFIIGLILVVITAPIWINFVEGLWDGLAIEDWATKLENKANWAGQELGRKLAGKELAQDPAPVGHHDRRLDGR